MSQGAHRFEDRYLPCVIWWYLNSGRLPTPSPNLTQSELQNAFREWCTFLRVDPPDVDEDEYLKCPFTNCRQTFSRLWDQMDHVWKFPHSTTYYWCPWCRRQENFAQHQPSQPVSHSSNDAPALEPERSCSLNSIGALFGGTDHPKELEISDGPISAASVPKITLLQVPPWRVDKDEHMLGSGSVAQATPTGLYGQRSTSWVRPTRSVKSEGFLNTHKPPATFPTPRLQLYQGVGPLPGDDLTSTVEPLFECVQTIRDRWNFLIISKNPHLQQRVATAFIVQRSIFETGFMTLQTCFGDGLPETFTEIFSLAHIVLASACLLHKDSKGYPWNTLPENMLHWAQFIVDESERALCTQVLQLLWATGAFSPNILAANVHQTPSTRSQKPMQVKYQSRNHLWQEIKQGQVLSQCVELLDELKYTAIARRNTKASLFPYWEPAQRLRSAEKVDNEILIPLQQSPGMDIIHHHVQDVREGLQIGLLLHPRDVEVALIRKCKDRPEIAHQLDFFVQTISQTFDTAWNDPDWRNRYYATTIVEALIAKTQLINRQNRPSVAQEHFASASKSTQMSPMVDLADHLPLPQDHGLTPLTSPMPMSPSPSLISDTDLVDLTDGWTSCSYPKCSTSFTGNEQDRKHNCKRHIKKQHEYAQKEPCPAQNCHRMFANEWNVKRHVGKDHPDLLVRSGPSDPIFIGKGKARAND